MSNLVIVESPAKAKTIQKYLGKGYDVIASMGHIRDLPKSKLGVDVENGFQPQYTDMKGKEDVIKKLKEHAKKCDHVYLATDPDREGEAISWHIAQLLHLDMNADDRVEFNEITRSGIQAGMSNPHKIDLDLVNAQQARRILDRLVGYKLSPFLWKKVRRGLSAGRVQSVAVRLVVDRENEIRAFVPQEYWSIDAKFTGEKFCQQYQREATIEEISEITKITREEIVTSLEASNEVESIHQSAYQKDGSEISLLDKLSKGENESEKVVDHVLLKEAMKHLEQKEQQMIYYRYFEGKTQQEIAKIFHISQVQVSRIEKRILKKLRRQMIGNI